MTGDTPKQLAFLDRLWSRSVGSSARGRRGGPWRYFLLIAFTTTFLTLRCAPYLSAPEFGLLNGWFRGREARTPDPRIALIGIEKKDVEAFAQERLSNCACGNRPRDELGRLVARLKAAGAAVVAIDFFFDRNCPVGEGTPQGHDAVLQQALRNPGENVLIAGANPLPDKIIFTPPCPGVMGDTDPIVASPVLHKPRGVIIGVDLVQHSPPADSPPLELGHLRAVQAVYPAFSLAIYSAFKGVPREIPQEVSDAVVRCATLDIPVWPTDDICLLSPVPVKPEDAEGRHVMLTNWVGPVGTFPMYSYRACVQGSDTALAEQFRGKMVLVGSLKLDRQHTPMSQRVVSAAAPFVDQSDELTMSGLETHANCLDTILQQRFVRALPRPWACLLVLMCTLLTAAAFKKLRLFQAVIVVVAQVVATVLLARLLIAHDFWLYSFIPSLAVVTTGTCSAILGYSYARQEATELIFWKKAWEEAAGIIYHDNVQPLAAIGALVQVLRARQARQDEADGEATKLLALIDDSANQALGNLRELRDLISDRPLTLEKQEFDLLSLIRDLALAQSARSSIHNVEVYAPADEVRVKADARRLSRAFNNLLDNAIKYWPQGGTIVVDVTTTPIGAVVKVIDGGLGIAPQQQAHVFEFGGRAIHAGSKIAGSGIGLYSVRRIIEAHLGTVTLDSEPGKGSTFTVTLPYE